MYRQPIIWSKADPRLHHLGTSFTPCLSWTVPIEQSAMTVQNSVTPLLGLSYLFTFAVSIKRSSWSVISHFDLSYRSSGKTTNSGMARTGHMTIERIAFQTNIVTRYRTDNLISEAQIFAVRFIAPYLALQYIKSHFRQLAGATNAWCYKRVPHTTGKRLDGLSNSPCFRKHQSELCGYRSISKERNAIWFLPWPQAYCIQSWSR